MVESADTIVSKTIAERRPSANLGKPTIIFAAKWRITQLRSENYATLAQEFIERTPTLTTRLSVQGVLLHYQEYRGEGNAKSHTGQPHYGLSAHPFRLIYSFCYSRNESKRVQSQLRQILEVDE